MMEEDKVVVGDVGLEGKNKSSHFYLFSKILKTQKCLYTIGFIYKTKGSDKI